MDANCPWSLSSVRITVVVLCKCDVVPLIFVLLNEFLFTFSLFKWTFSAEN